jgi:hypothetical protein
VGKHTTAHSWQNMPGGPAPSVASLCSPFTFLQKEWQGLRHNTTLCSGHSSIACPLVHSTPRFIVAAQVEQTPCIAMAVVSDWHKYNTGRAGQYVTPQGLMFVIVSPLTPVTDTTSPFKHIFYPGNPSPPAPPDKSPKYIIPCSPFFRCVHAYPLLLGSQAGITAAVCNCTLNLSPDFGLAPELPSAAEICWRTL